MLQPTPPLTAAPVPSPGAPPPCRKPSSAPSPPCRGDGGNSNHDAMGHGPWASEESVLLGAPRPTHLTGEETGAQRASHSAPAPETGRG